MNRHALVAVAASAVIAGSAAYALLGAAALSDAQFKWAGGGDFGYVSLINGGYIEICNPWPLPVRLDSLEIDALYQGEDFASFHAKGGIIGAGSTGVLLGEGEPRGSEASVLSMYMDSGASGADASRFDGGDVEATATLRTLVLGLIPHSVTREYSGAGFFDVMDGGRGYAC